MSTPPINTEPALRENGFYYKRPELGSDVLPAVHYLVSMGSLASRMVIELRTRTLHPDGRRENVAEHAHMLSRVVTATVRHYRDRLPGEITEGEVSLYADVHDDVEAYVRDTATDFITEEELRQKELREAEGAKQLYEEFRFVDPGYAARVLRYEQQIDPNARLTRLKDKDTTLLIHIANGGSVLRIHYSSKDDFLQRVFDHNRRLRLQFPEFAWLVDDRDALAIYVADIAFPAA